MVKTVHGYHMGREACASWGWAALPCPPVTTSWHMVSVGWLLGKFGEGSTALLPCCFSSEEITTGKTPICQKTLEEKGEGRVQGGHFPTLACNHGNCTFDLHTRAAHGPAAALDENAAMP